MIRTIPLAAAAAATLFLSACANDLAPDPADRAPAPFVDPSGAVPRYRENILGDGSI